MKTNKKKPKPNQTQTNEQTNPKEHIRDTLQRNGKALVVNSPHSCSPPCGHMVKVHLKGVVHLRVTPPAQSRAMVALPWVTSAYPGFLL